MFIYWISIIIWQTIRPVANRSLIDTVMKIVLFLPVLVYGWKHNEMSKNTDTFPLFVIFLITQLLTFILDSGELKFSSFITMVFMLMEVVIFLIFLFRETCKEIAIEKFCFGLIVVAIIMSLYNIVFDFSKFSYVFSGGAGSYGHECTSFLYSNHEFGLYLSVSILSLFWLFFKKKIKGFKFFLIGVLLSANLLTTYSRTAIIGLLGALAILLFFYNKKTFAAFLAVFAVGLLIIANVDSLKTMFFDNILKGSLESGESLDEQRGGIYIEAWTAFKNGTFIRVLLGYGYAGAGKYAGHNAYLVVLLTGGVLMMAFFVLMLFFGIKRAFFILKRDRQLGALLLGYIVFALLYMIPQTPILFYSTMDSFFITMTAVLLPLYISNGMKKGDFYENTSNQLCVSKRQYGENC